MQQRQLRLGDILDDYCPRERRLANHTIVAMVGDEIRLTRCTTCDTEHPYKGGKAPRLRKKKVIAAVPPGAVEVAETVKDPQGTLVTHSETEESAEPVVEEVSANGGAPQDSNGNAPQHAPEEVRLHRPLIRAQLPRIEREAAPRPVPEFTIRQANKRQGRFQNSRQARFAKGGPMNRQGGNPRGPDGRQGGRPQGGGGGNRMPTRQGGRPGQHSGKKRSR
jgi:hypothetical protein